MKNALILTKEDEKLKAVADEIIEFRTMVNQRIDFLKKQFDQLDTDQNKFHKESWDKIEQILKEKQLLPKDYSTNKYVLSHDQDITVFFIETKEDHQKSSDNNPLKSLLSHLFGKD